MTHKFSTPFRAPGRSRSAGFSLAELLVVILVIGILATFAVSRLDNTYRVLRLEGAANDLSTLFRRARAEAIKMHYPAVVVFDFANHEVRAFVDIPPLTGLGAGQQNYIFNPVAGMPHRETDYLVADYLLPLKDGQPAHTAFWGPADGAPNGPDALIDFSTYNDENGVPRQVAVFLPDGTLENTGAVRIADLAGLNFLEVALETRSGVSEVRKYLLPADSPTGSAAFFGRAFGTAGEVAWVWY